MSAKSKKNLKEPNVTYMFWPESNWSKPSRRIRRHPNWNYQPRVTHWPELSINQQFILKTWQRLHRLSSHSMQPIEVKWHAIAKKWDLAHFGSISSGRMTARYANTWTCHAWI